MFSNRLKKTLGILIMLAIMIVPTGFVYINDIMAESSVEANEQLDLSLGAIEALDNVKSIPDLIFVMETLLRVPISELKDGEPPYNQEPPDAQQDFRIPTDMPPTMMPPTQAPPTMNPPTMMPPTMAPPTMMPPTMAPPTMRPPPTFVPPPTRRPIPPTPPTMRPNPPTRSPIDPPNQPPNPPNPIPVPTPVIIVPPTQSPNN